MRAGIHYRGDHANSAKVVVSVLRAAGVPLPEWGVAGMRTTEGLRDIEI